MPASEAQSEATRERRKKAVALRLAGVTFEQIAERLGYADRQSAAKDIQRAYDASNADLTRTTEELRAEEDARLQRLMLAVYPRAINGDLKAAEVALRISESRRKLYRLDKPEQIEVITVDQIDRELRALAEQFPGLTADPAAGSGREVPQAAGPAAGAGSEG